MSVALDHRQALPPAELLDRAQVYLSHDEPGGESVPVPMPRVRVQVPVAFPSASGTLLARSTAAEKNFVWLPVRAQGKTSSWGSSGRCRCVATSTSTARTTIFMGTWREYREEVG